MKRQPIVPDIIWLLAAIGLVAVLYSANTPKAGPVHREKVEVPPPATPAAATSEPWVTRGEKLKGIPLRPLNADGAGDRVCAGNLREIEERLQDWGLNSPSYPESLEKLGKVPTCPSGGRYHYRRHPLTQGNIDLLQNYFLIYCDSPDHKGIPARNSLEGEVDPYQLPYPRIP